MKPLIKILTKLSTIFLNAAVAGMLALLMIYFHFIPQLPNTEQIQTVQLQTPLRIFTRQGLLIAEYGSQRRTPITFEQVPKQLINAILAAEDDRFFSHPGVDYQGLLRAAVELARSGGQIRQGGSTITMQVARNFFLSSEKKFTRKIKEILLALKLERELSKQEIFALYLNKIFLGHRAYGVAAAAQVYYGGSLKKLNLAQIAMIAGLPKAPSAYNPIVNPKRALQRRHYILKRMLKLNFISTTEYNRANTAPVTASIHKQNIIDNAPYIAEMVRAEMVERYGTEAYTNGYHVYTTIQQSMQNAANDALQRNLQAYDQRHGYRGPENHADTPQAIKDIRAIAGLLPGFVTQVDKTSAHVYLQDGNTITLTLKNIQWARRYLNENRRGAKPSQVTDVLKVGDIIRVKRRITKKGKTWTLSQLPKVEGAFIALAPKNGAILALTGGFDFYQSKFNRATQAQRQPGSGFKPFVYSAALEKGFTAASLINDAPIVDLNDSEWRPANYDHKFGGPTRFRQALLKSKNLVSIRILRKIGIKYAIEYAQQFGFNPKNLPYGLSLALGSGTASPLHMAGAYASFANGGYKVTPYLIDRIENATGKLLYQAEPSTVCSDCTDLNSTSTFHPATRIITAENCYIMTDIMQDNMKRGTGRRARVLKRADIAGKTGTTNDQRDAWFYGFTPDIVAVSWVGFDQLQPLGRRETGSHAALPPWIDFMKQVLPNFPEKKAPLPAGITTVRIDPNTGLRARMNQKNAIFEIFRRSNIPPFAPKNTPSTTSPQPIF